MHREDCMQNFDILLNSCHCWYRQYNENSIFRRQAETRERDFPRIFLSVLEGWSCIRGSVGSAAVIRTSTGCERSAMAYLVMSITPAGMHRMPTYMFVHVHIHARIQNVPRQTSSANSLTSFYVEENEEWYDPS